MTPGLCTPDQCLSTVRVGPVGAKKLELSLSLQLVAFLSPTGRRRKFLLFFPLAFVLSFPAFAGLQKASLAEQHVDTGLKLAQAGDLKGAESELRKAVEVSPKDWFCLASLGGILGMQQKLEESSRFLERALKINPNDWATRRNLASNQYLLGDLYSARQNLEMILKVKPDDNTSVLLLGMVAENLQDYKRAVNLLMSIPDLVRQKSESLAALARSYYHTNQKEKARQTLGLLRGHSAGADGMFLGGQVAAEAGDYETAEELFSSIGSIYPDVTKLGYNLALVQYQSDQIERSQATLLKLIEGGHVSNDIYNLLSWCYHEQGKLKEAVAAMDRAIDRNPAEVANYLDLARILLNHKRYPVALEAAKKAVELAPNSYEAYKLKGIIEGRMGNLVEAVKTYTRAVELSPNSPEAILALAGAQATDGKIEEANATFEQGIQRFPRDLRLHLEFGRMLLRTAGGSDDAKETRAVSLLKKAIALDGSVGESYYQLGNLALTKENPEEAIEYLETALKLSPRSSKVHFALARAYRRVGNQQRAQEEERVYENLKARESATVQERPVSKDRPTAIDLLSDE
jgi:tetratricopeptide (TPR) repeat protein